jgi:hypothetical protein
MREVIAFTLAQAMVAGRRLQRVSREATLSVVLIIQNNQPHERGIETG